MTPRRRWIAHLDMDAFYASVELLRYPELLGEAVVIGGGRRAQPEVLADGTRRFATLATYKGRGVITVDGRMVELLHAEMAARTVAIARAVAAHAAG